MSDGAGKFERLVDGGIENLMRSFFDEYEKENAEFRSQSGLAVEVIREEVGDCCDWCADIAGNYDYWDAPKEVWQRHEHCRCMVITRTTKGTYQDAWSRKEYQSRRDARIAREEELTDDLIAERTRNNKNIQNSLYSYEDAQHVNMDYVNSREYRDKFTGITDDPRIDAKACEMARSILEHRSGTKLEDLILIDLSTGEVVLDYRTSDKEDRVKYTPEIEKHVKKLKQEGRKILAIHNHPNGFPPSADDASSALAHGYSIGVACGHNGRVYIYGPSEFPLSIEDCEIIHGYIDAKCIGTGMQEHNAEIVDKQWSKVLNIFGVYFEGR